MHSFQPRPRAFGWRHRAVPELGAALSSPQGSGGRVAAGPSDVPAGSGTEDGTPWGAGSGMPASAPSPVAPVQNASPWRMLPARIPRAVPCRRSRVAASGENGVYADGIPPPGSCRGGDGGRAPAWVLHLTPGWPKPSFDGKPWLGTWSCGSRPGWPRGGAEPVSGCVGWARGLMCGEQPPHTPHPGVICHQIP